MIYIIAHLYIWGAIFLYSVAKEDDLQTDWGVIAGLIFWPIVFPAMAIYLTIQEWRDR